MIVDAPKCPYCGSWHDSKCPLVKSIEMNPDGTVKRVEFFPKVPNNDFAEWVRDSW